MELYLSQLLLNRQAIQGLRITDHYSLHRVVYSLFSETRTGEQQKQSQRSGIQWVDKGGDQLHREILLLSDRCPMCGYSSNGVNVQTKKLPMEWFEQQHYRFMVVMNPVQRENQSRKIVPVKGRNEIAQWFLQRTSQWGFSVEPRYLSVYGIKVMRFHDKQHLVTLQQATLSGYLQVIDKGEFIQSIAQGIGRARTFGCGLLQLSPVT